jgi:hypothetical protein
MARRIRVYMRDENMYVGTLVSGTFVLEGRSVPVSAIKRLDLPWYITGVRATDGEIELTDEVCLTVHGFLRSRWFSSWVDYDITGSLCVHLESLDEDVTVDVRSIKRLFVQTS